MAERLPVGLLGDFGTPERLVAAARAVRDDGARDIRAFTPFPVDELNAVLGLHDRRIPWLGVAGGIFGAAGAYAMQIAVNLDYPLDIGGRPVVALQAFALIGFELLVLFAVLFMVGGFLLFNRLPRYHHPLFWVERFERATRDGFFLFVPTADAAALDEARALFARLGAETLDEVPR